MSSMMTYWFTITPIKPKVLTNMWPYSSSCNEWILQVPCGQWLYKINDTLGGGSGASSWVPLRRRWKRVFLFTSVCCGVCCHILRIVYHVYRLIDFFMSLSRTIHIPYAIVSRGSAKCSSCFADNMISWKMVTQQSIIYMLVSQFICWANIGLPENVIGLILFSNHHF